jgi:high-affinity iron transporter
MPDGSVRCLLAGGVTWAIATYAVSISGAEREATEGLSALFAAIVLLSVGIWMHQKSMAGRWQQYLQEKMSAALTRRSATFLFVLSFVAVYREVFETILFYAAMWNEQDSSAILAGLGLGLAVLAVIAFALLRLGTRLPIGQFFRFSSILIAVLAVVLVGKGVAALQEAGWISQKALAAVPQIEWLGLYPTWQSILAQLAVAAIAILGFVANARGAKAMPSAHERPRGNA